MLLGMVTVNATTFLIGQNSLVCLNDFLQNNDPEPRTGLADHKRRLNGTRSKGQRNPKQSTNRVNERNVLHVSCNGIEIP